MFSINFNQKLVATLDRGKRQPEDVFSKAVIFEIARDVSERSLCTPHSVACIAFEFGKFGTKVPCTIFSSFE